MGLQQPRLDTILFASCALAEDNEPIGARKCRNVDPRLVTTHDPQVNPKWATKWSLQLRIVKIINLGSPKITR